MSAIALLTDHHQYFLYAGHTDMRKSFHGLYGIVRNELGKEVGDRDIFIFLNKRCTHIKLPRLCKALHNLGRHNHLFAGSHRGGELAAIIYSFIATCKLQNIDPAKWLDDVLRRIPQQPENKLTELLPQFWKPLHQSKVKSA